jgi:hypothetical protein
MIEQKLKMLKDNNDPGQDNSSGSEWQKSGSEEDDEDDDDDDRSKKNKRKRKGGRDGGGSKKKRKLVKKSDKKSKGKKSNKNKNEKDEEEDEDKDEGGSSGNEDDFETINLVAQNIERSIVQKAMKKFKSSEQDKNVEKLNDSYNRCANALIGTYSNFTWYQMSADNVKGQRGEVVATVAGINEKIDVHPTAPVS